MSFSRFLPCFTNVMSSWIWKTPMLPACSQSDRRPKLPTAIAYSFTPVGFKVQISGVKHISRSHHQFIYFMEKLEDTRGFQSLLQYLSKLDPRPYCVDLRNTPTQAFKKAWEPVLLLKVGQCALQLLGTEVQKNIHPNFSFAFSDACRSRSRESSSACKNNESVQADLPCQAWSSSVHLSGDL